MKLILYATGVVLSNMIVICGFFEQSTLLGYIGTTGILLFGIAIGYELKKL